MTAKKESTPDAETDAHVEKYGPYVWECSAGDFVSRVSADEVGEHIATEHQKKS